MNENCKSLPITSPVLCWMFCPIKEPNFPSCFTNLADLTTLSSWPCFQFLQLNHAQARALASRYPFQYCSNQRIIRVLSQLENTQQHECMYECTHVSMSVFMYVC